MPKAYLISAYHEIHDQDALAAYAKLALPSLTATTSPRSCQPSAGGGAG
jgi:hypothetical protein